jgi:hypothetical protein
MAQGRTLQVFIAADTKRFRDGLDDAERRMGGFQGALGGLAGSFKNMLGPAMLGAGVAAGALATQFAVDGVQAAMAQEEANAKLARAFAAVGLAQDVEKAKAYVDEMQRATGVSEENLMPALTTLATKTKDLETAQNLLGIALDTSQAKGIPLETVTAAIAKAMDGNTTSLGRLIPELDKAALKTGGLEGATDQLQALFGGAAATQAETFKGKIDILKTGVGELQESFGEGFLGAIQTAMDKLNGEDSLGQTMQDLEPIMFDLGEQLGTLLGDLALITIEAGKAYTAFTEWKDGMGPIGQAIDLLLVSPITRLADALRELNRLRGAGDTPAGVTFGSPQAGLTASNTGGGDFTPVGRASVSSSRTPTIVAPLTALSKATASQARRTGGKVVLLG